MPKTAKKKKSVRQRSKPRKKTTTSATAPAATRKPLKKAKEVLARLNVDRTLSVLHLEQYDVYYNISGVALECFQLIDGKKTEADIVVALQKRYPDESKKVPRKVNDWVREFKKFGLIG